MLYAIAMGQITSFGGNSPSSMRPRRASSVDGSELSTCRPIGLIMTATITIHSRVLRVIRTATATCQLMIMSVALYAVQTVATIYTLRMTMLYPLP